MSSLSIDHLRAALQTPAPSVAEDPDFKLAAVLVLLYQRDQDYRVVLTKRTELVANHKGEVCFPGGRHEPAVDQSLMHTALRESAEEIGLRTEETEVLGALEARATRFKFLVTPYVAVLKTPHAFTPQPTEVAEVLEIPLDYLLSPEALSTEPMAWRDVNISTPYFRYNDHIIWGATARILQQFLSLLSSDQSDQAGAQPKPELSQTSTTTPPRVR